MRRQLASELWDWNNRGEAWEQPDRYNACFFQFLVILPDMLQR